MSTTSKLILAVPAAAFMIFLGAMVSGRDAVDVRERETVKVSEQRSGNGYTRTTEVFRGGVRISRTRESSRAGDSNFTTVVIDLFRGDQRVFRAGAHQDKYGTNNSRLYFNGERIVVEEQDRDDDGWFESLILYDENELPFEAFTKRQSGMVEVWPSAKLEELRQFWLRLQEVEMPPRVQEK